MAVICWCALLLVLEEDELRPSREGLTLLAHTNFLGRFAAAIQQENSAGSRSAALVGRRRGREHTYHTASELPPPYSLTTPASDSAPLNVVPGAHSPPTPLSFGPGWHHQNTFSERYHPASTGAHARRQEAAVDHQCWNKRRDGKRVIWFFKKKIIVNRWCTVL